MLSNYKTVANLSQFSWINLIIKEGNLISIPKSNLTGKTVTNTMTCKCYSPSCHQLTTETHLGLGCGRVPPWPLWSATQTGQARERRPRSILLWGETCHPVRGPVGGAPQCRQRTGQCRQYLGQTQRQGQRSSIRVRVRVLHGSTFGDRHGTAPQAPDHPWLHQSLICTISTRTR